MKSAVQAHRIWPDLIKALHRLLVLDYDGTLMPFHDDPEEVLLSRPVLQLLERIASGGTSVAIISGRRLVDLAGRIGRLPVTLIGEHGWDVLDAGGRLVRHPLPAASASGLLQAMETADGAPWGERVEPKRTSLLLHTRGLPCAEAKALCEMARSAWEPGTARGELRLDLIREGLELRARGRNKATAVRDLMVTLSSDTIPVYLGNDASDEDGFGDVLKVGYAFRVGQDDRCSLGHGHLASPREVEAFLERWLEASGRRRVPATRRA